MNIMKSAKEEKRKIIFFSFLMVKFNFFSDCKIIDNNNNMYISQRN